MRISHLYQGGAPVISFELFPPRTEQAEQDLFDRTIPGLKSLKPGYISVTYGAGGSTRVNTLRIVRRIRQEFGVEAAHHLTCVSTTRETLAGTIDEIQTLGIENLLALRGDPPRGETTFTPTAGGFAYALDLIRFVRGRNSFCIGAACYPEGHVECGDKRLDWDRAADKVEAGAEFLITQLFYDWEDFLKMEDYLRNRRQVKVPIIPGVLPFLKTEQIKRFTKMCGSRLAEPLLAQLERLVDDDHAVRELGIEVATNLCRKALAHGVKGIHFYCLNQLYSCREVLRNLGFVARNPCQEE